MDISPHTWPGITSLLTCRLPPKTSESIPGPASTIWLPCSSVLFPGVCMLAASNFPLPKLSYSVYPSERVAVSSSEGEPWWNVSHLPTYPFPLFLATLLGATWVCYRAEWVVHLFTLFVFRSRNGQFGEVLLSMSDYSPVLPFPGGVKFSSIPTLKRLWEGNGVLLAPQRRILHKSNKSILLLSIILALLHQAAESPAPALAISSLRVSRTIIEHPLTLHPSLLPPSPGPTFQVVSLNITPGLPTTLFVLR